MIALVLAGVASAMDCAAIESMVKAGLDASTIVSTLGRCAVDDAATVACLEADRSTLGIPHEVIVAARAAVVDESCAPGPLPEPTAPTVSDPGSVRAQGVATERDAARGARAGRRGSLPPEYWETPDPGVAVGLSTGVGFGAGHFYAHEPAAGGAFALSEAAAILLGVVAAKSGNLDLSTAGWISLLVLRSTDIATAGVSAQATRRWMLAP